MSVRRRTGYDVSSLVVGCMLPELFVALPMVQLSMTKKAVFFSRNTGRERMIRVMTELESRCIALKLKGSCCVSSNCDKSIG